MLTFAPNLRIYLHARPTDMRNSFDGLCALVLNVCPSVQSLSVASRRQVRKNSSLVRPPMRNDRGTWAAWSRRSYSRVRATLSVVLSAMSTAASAKSACAQ